MASAGGSRADNERVVKRNSRRSDKLASSAIAMRADSQAMPTGSPWNSPAEKARFGSSPGSSISITGLSVTLLISMSITCCAKPSWSRTAPRMTGVHRRE